MAAPLPARARSEGSTPDPSDPPRRVHERRIGVRHAIDALTMAVPAGPGARPLGAPDRVSAAVVNLSVTGAAVVLPEGRAVEVGTVLPVELEGVAGTVRVCRVHVDEERGIGYLGVAFVGESLLPVTTHLVELATSSERMGTTLIDLLEELASWIERTAMWSDDEANLRRVADDLSVALTKLPGPGATVAQIVASVCWVDCGPETTGELDDLGEWPDTVNRELGRYPFETKQELAKALILLGQHPCTSPLGHRVLPALAESLLV